MNWETWLLSVATALLGGVVYLTRRVFTNQAEIAIVRKQLEVQSVDRQRRDVELNNFMREIREDIKDILKHK